MFLSNGAVILLVAVCTLSAADFNYDDNEISEGPQRFLYNSNWASDQQFPYHLSITSTSPQGNVFCSGSLIHPRWVLTTASCVFRSQSYRVRGSTVTFYTGGTEQVSTTSFIHPHYNPSTNDNDVALIQLSRSILFATPIALLPTNQSTWDISGRISVISGWGLSRSNDQSPVLQFAYGQVQRNFHPHCRNNFGVNGALLPNSQLCSTFFNQPIRTCSGDTGSPLAIQVNQTWFQVGVAVNSASQNSCGNSTSLFTRVTHVYNWINEIVDF